MRVSQLVYSNEPTMARSIVRRPSLMINEADKGVEATVVEVAVYGDTSYS
jgi:hypothetical protein